MPFRRDSAVRWLAAGCKYDGRFSGGPGVFRFPSSRRRSGSEPSGTGENPGRLWMILRKIFPDCSGIPMLTATGAGAERTSRSSLSDGKASVGSRSTAFPHSGGRLYSNSVTVPGFRNRERRAGGRPPSVWMEISLRRGDGLLFLTAILQWPGPTASTGVIPANPHFPEVSLHPVRIARREPSGQWM